MSYSFGAWCQAGRNLDLLLYFIISYLFIYTLAIVGCPCWRSLPTGSTHHVQKTPHAGLAQSLFERLIPFVLGVKQVKKILFYFIILYLYSWNCRWSLSEIIAVWVQSSCEKKTCRVTTVSLWTPCYPWSEAIQATGKIPASDVLCLNNATLMLLLFPCFIL